MKGIKDILGFFKLYILKSHYVASMSVFVGLLIAIFLIAKGKALLIPETWIWFNFIIQWILWFLCSYLFISLVIYLYKFITKNRYCKYCPECDKAKNINCKDNFCNCGTEYLTICPNCKAKIKDTGQSKLGNYLNRICHNCGNKFSIKPKTGNEWMTHSKRAHSKATS